jgi:hypothetical protein
MKNQPERLLERGAALGCWVDDVWGRMVRINGEDKFHAYKQRTDMAVPEVERKHRLNQAMIVMWVSDSAYTFTPKLCLCSGLGLRSPNGVSVPHVHRLSRRCHG